MKIGSSNDMCTCQNVMLIEDNVVFSLQFMFYLFRKYSFSGTKFCVRKNVDKDVAYCSTQLPCLIIDAIGI